MHGVGAFNAAMKLKPRVIKVMDFSFQYLNELRNAIPDAFIIGRLEPQPDFNGSVDNARRAGKDYAERCKAHGHGIISAYEVPNEKVFNDTPDIQHVFFDAFHVAFREALLPNYEAVAFCIGNGHGSPEFKFKLYPETLKTYKYLAFHEYNHPLLLSNDPGWMELRYRKSYKTIQDLFKKEYTVILTEIGVTQAAKGGKDVGWLSNEKTYPGCISPIPAQQYFNNLVAYSNELMKDPYVMGACMFDMAGWDTFEHVPIITDMLYKYQTTTTTPPPAPLTYEQGLQDAINRVSIKVWDELKQIRK